jgi:hypothetical protein
MMIDFHLLGKTSTNGTIVIFVPFYYSESTAVLPTGLKIGHITQKEPGKKVSGLTDPRPDFAWGDISRN